MEVLSPMGPREPPKGVKPKPRGGWRWLDPSVSPALGTEAMDVQMQLTIEGLEKRTSFVVRGSVKHAGEPSTEIMWLQASCKAASPQSAQGSTQTFCGAQSGRQGL